MPLKSTKMPFSFLQSCRWGDGVLKPPSIPHPSLDLERMSECIWERSHLFKKEQSFLSFLFFSLCSFRLAIELFNCRC